VNIREASIAYIEEAKALDHAGEADNLLAKIQRIRPISPPDRVFEVGVGTGWLLAELADRGFECAGIEVNPWNVEYARQRLPDVEVIEGTIEATELPAATYDLVLAESVLEHVRDYEPALRNIFQGLKAGGVFHLSTTNKFSLVSGEFRKVPLYGWLPQRARYAIRRRVGEEVFFDWNEFTYVGLRRALRRAGFSEVYDRLDVVRPADKTGWKRQVVGTYQRFPVLKWPLLTFDFGVGLFAVK
jgi:SAM-dependent methyltransferase